MTSAFKMRSLDKKFIIPAILLTIVLFGLLTLINIKTVKSILSSQMDARGNAMANYMAKTSVFYYYNYDLGALEGFVKELVKDPEVSYAVFYDETGNPVTISSKEPDDKSAVLVYDSEIKTDDGQRFGHLSIGYSRDKMSASIGRLGKMMAVTSLFTLIIVVAGINLGIKRIVSRPLQQAVSVANRLAQGDLTITSSSSNNDEVGQLLTTLNHTVKNLKELISRVSESTMEVYRSSNDITQAVQDQAIVSSQQSSSVAEISSTMEELSASSKQISENAESVASIAEKTLEDTKHGATAFETFIARISDIHTDNEQSIKEIVELGNKSKEITKVMEIINTIADQTKLIAFNAALEASSAGEAGKRFGVVAAEIRRLADSVMESTGEIEARINEIQEAINRLVISSEKGSKGIREGLDHSMQIGEILSAIVTGADSTTSAAKQISLSTRQQMTASDQVVAAIREIADGTKKSSESIGQITGICTSLSGLSEKLTGLVEQFKLDGDGDSYQG